MTEFILELMAWGGYFGIFVLMALENIFPPIPSEVIMGLAGMSVERGDMSMLPLILWASVGTVLGNMFWYGLGRWLGYERFKPIIDRYGRWMTLDWDEVEKFIALFNKHGLWVVFACRFVPTFRTLISLPAGMAKMGLPRFLIATVAGSAIWNTVLAYAGYFLGKNFSQVEEFVGPLVFVVIGAIVVTYVYRVFTWRPKPKEAQ